MRLDNPYDELSPGRLFTHGQLNDPMSGGPLYCRLRGFDGAEVEYEEIYHREDGSERIGSPRRLPIQFFIEETFGAGTREPRHRRRRRERHAVCRCPWTLGRSEAGQLGPDRFGIASADPRWALRSSLPAAH
jgi:hypothetical protein